MVVLEKNVYIMGQPIDIQIERSLTNTPTTLLYGEPAWADATQELYIGDSSGTPILINPGGAIALIQSNEGSDDIINYNNVADTTVTLSNVVQVDTPDFSWNAGTNRLTCNFNGTIVAGFHVSTTSTGSRNSVNIRLIREGISPTEQFGESYTYIRNTGGHTRDAVSNTSVFEVQNGDTIRLSIRRFGINTSATNLADRCEMYARRLK